MIGRLTTGSSGLGWFAVIGRSRVPSPPAITTAFTVTSCRAVSSAGPAPVVGTSCRTWTRYSTPAHQYRAVPQIANAQPTIVRDRRRRTRRRRRARKSSGKA